MINFLDQYTHNYIRDKKKYHHSCFNKHKTLIMSRECQELNRTM